jgi:hypothetical protein
MDLEKSKVNCTLTPCNPTYSRNAKYVTDKWQLDFDKIVSEVDKQYAALQLNFAEMEATHDKSKLTIEQTQARLAEHKRALEQLCAEKKNKLDAFYVSALRGPTLMSARIVMANVC